jgi:transposase
MSLHPEDPTAPPEETQRVARAAFPKGTLCLDIADALGPIYRDSQFAGLFPQLGQPAAAPATVLQYLEGLSDIWRACPIVRPPMPSGAGSTGSMRYDCP